MATNTAAKPEPQHPPLARDALGNLIAIPDGTVAWRMCRQTTGRPKEIVGPDKRPMRFPLELTAEELSDLCGADVYRVYGLDEVGKVLDYVVTVDLTRDAREQRNAAPDAWSAPAPRTSALMPTTDLRFALEAMAQMMRVNCEALRAVTESQADWVKSIASAKGFFRNGAPPLAALSTPPRIEAELEEDDDESTEDDAPASKTIYDVLAPLAEHWAPSVSPVVAMLAGGAAEKVSGRAATAGDGSKAGWELRELLDLNYAASKARAKKAASDQSAASKSAGRASLQSRVMADPRLMAHFIAIKSLLAPNEAARILALGEQMSEEQQEWLVAKMGALSAEEAAAGLRKLLADVNNAVAAAPTSEPSA